MPTPFDLSSAYVDEQAALQPLLSTRLGIPGSDHLWGNLGIDGAEAAADLDRRYLRDLEPGTDDPDPDQRLAARVMVRYLCDRLAAFDAGDHLRDLRHMASSFQFLVRVFDVMDTASEDGRRNVLARLQTLGSALDEYRSRLAAGIDAGIVAAVRQVRSVIDQATVLAGPESSFDKLRRQADPQDTDPGPWDRAVAAAKGAVGAFGAFLAGDYLPYAGSRDAIGEERYRLQADRFLGMGIEPAEAYRWGWDELRRLLREAGGVAEIIAPGSGFAGAVSLLETDPTRAAPSPGAFVDFIAARQEKALAELSGAHFLVDDRIRQITVNLAPPGTPLGAYYIGPSEDFSRPGGIWYALGDQQSIPLFHHVSTAYHEGFPGHHLQVGTARAHQDRISRAHRLLVWYPGYGEGWAMYAERLMGELGYFEEPEYLLGMLVKQLYRAVRVVVDIGLHLELEIPSSAPLGAGERWTIERAEEYLRLYASRTPAQARAEVLRYLGWGGQAIAYKLGEREILGLREALRSAHGSKFDLAMFHAAVLGRGPLPLEMLQPVVRADLVEEMR